VQSPSWEANWFAASQEIPRISRNPKVHYRTHKRPPPVSILVCCNIVTLLKLCAFSIRNVITKLQAAWKLPDVNWIKVA